MKKKKYPFEEGENTEKGQFPTERQSKDLDLDKLYMRDVGAVSRLSEKEERELWIKIREGNEDARSRYIEANLRLVISTAKEFDRCGVPESDLRGQGNVGLIKAVDKYDPAKGMAFSTYAVPIIRNEIISMLVCEKLIKVSETTLRRYKEATKQQEEATELKSEKKHGISQQTIQQVWAASQTHLSLTELENDEKKNTVRIDRIVYPTQEETNWETQITREALNELEKTQSRLLMLRWGMEDGCKHTLKETAKILGVTYSQVRTLEAKAKKDMQFYIKLRLWNEGLF